MCLHLSRASCGRGAVWKDGDVDQEAEEIRSVLRDAGVRGADDFGYFVNSSHLRASEFDAATAAPVLLARLPTLTQGSVVAAAARHLRHARIPHDEFASLVDVFRGWAARDFDAGWALGDALAHAARSDDGATMCDLAQNPAYGRSRQMIVHALWRWRKSFADVEETLRRLVSDPDVSLQAMSALARVIPPAEMVALLEPLAAGGDTNVREQARRQLLKARRKLTL